MASRKKIGKRVRKDNGDVITVKSQGNNNTISAGRGAKAVSSQDSSSVDIDIWRKKIEERVNALKDLLPADKADLKDNVAKITDEVSKGKKADKGRLERLLNTIGSMAPDILDVTIATLVNPLAGMGLVAKKIGDKAKVEKQIAS